MNRLRLLVLSILAASCAAVPAIDGEPAEIVNGTLDTGDPAVYWLLNPYGSCTAALISPHVVLTARHCLVDPNTDVLFPARNIRLSVGYDRNHFVRGPAARATRIIPNSLPIVDGAASTQGWGQDLGLIILSTPANETPLTISRDDYRTLTGQSFTAIGFGETPSHTVGVKYTTMGTVTSTSSAGIIFVNNVICQGDSGGPFVHGGTVWGTVSFGQGTMPGMLPDCGTSTGAYNALFPNLAWVDSVLEEAGDICLHHPEVCDGIDNDCDGVPDEGCLALGQACTDAAHCTSGHCEQTSAGMICTSPCDATGPGAECGSGFRCVRSTDCAGWCLPQAQGTLGYGVACTSDDTCTSGACIDPGDGARRCLAPCFGDSGQCASGEVCTAGNAACGVCVSSAIFGAPRGLGEECTDDASCRSGHCTLRSGVRECTTPCDSSSRCAPGFVCESDNCVLDRAQPSGGVCGDQADCAAGLCIGTPTRRWCTPGDCSTMMCPTGFTCGQVMGASVCTPTLALAGEACSSDTDCTTGLCYQGVCSSVCFDAASCGAGMRCVRDMTPAGAHCVAPAPVQHGGCSVSAAPSILSALLVLGSLAMLRRRRGLTES